MCSPIPSLFVSSLVALGGFACGGLQAADLPVPVLSEPHHHVAMANDYIRTLEVRLAPGERTQYHVHRVPSVVVELSQSTIVSQEWGGPAPVPSDKSPGDTRYADYDVKPLLHQVTNRGSGQFHVMDIELLQPNVEPAAGWPPLLATPASLLFQKKQVRAYRLTLGPGEHFAVPETAAAHLLIAYAGRLEQTTALGVVQLLQAGEEAFDPAQTGLSLTNRSGVAAEAILLELETTGAVRGSAPAG
jgi:hypothetical protein